MTTTLYVTDGRVFATQSATYVNAWGATCLTGTLFDTETGAVQINALCSCNMPVSADELVRGTFATFGYQVRDVVTL